MAAQMIAIPSAKDFEINLLLKLINNDSSCKQWLVLGIMPSDPGSRMVKLNSTMCKIGVERLAI